MKTAEARSENNSHISAPTEYAEGNGVRVAYRRLGNEKGIPLVFIFGGGAPRPLLLLQHFMGTLDNWDPAVTNTLASGRDVILFDNAGGRTVKRSGARHGCRNGGACDGLPRWLGRGDL